MRNLWQDKTTLAITCGKGIVPLLRQELTEMGYEILGDNETMVGIRAKNACRDILRLNLHLRTAQRVLWPFVQDVRCRSLDDLYRLAYYAPWEQVLDVDQPFFVSNATTNVESIRDTRMPTLRLKDAIVDRMRDKCGRRPTVGDYVPVRVEADGKPLFDKRAPLRGAMRVVRAALEDWLAELPEEQERAELLVEVDGYDLMSGELPVSRIDFQTLKRRFERTFGSRLTEGTPGAAVFLWWEGSHAKIYLDTSGTSLSRRGYRKEGWVAPMQEALAAACVLATGWDRKSPFVVPFSGSGTPAIEAAMLARNIAPGLTRSDFAFMHLKGWDSIIPGESAGVSARKRFGATPHEIWREVVAQAKAAERPFNDPDLPKILGVDWEEEAVDIADRNANAAGVGQNVDFFVEDFTDTPLPKTPGVIFMNPPYGERLEDEASLEPLYEGIGTWLRETVPEGWRAWVFTSSRPLSLKIHLRHRDLLPFKNGPLDCRLISYDVGGDFFNEAPETAAAAEPETAESADNVPEAEPATNAEEASESVPSDDKESEA